MYYGEEDYGVVFVIGDRKVKKLIGVLKTTKRDNTVEKKINRILLTKKPRYIYDRIIGNKSRDELADINNMNDNEKLNELKGGICVIDFIQARHIFLDKFKSFLTEKFIRYFFDIIMEKFFISKDESSNSKKLDEDLFPNTISVIPSEYKMSISNKKDLRKVTVKALKDIGEGKMEDIINQMKREWKINRNLKLDYKVLAQYIKGHYKHKKRGKGSGNMVYIA